MTPPAEINVFLGEGDGHIKYIVNDPLSYDANNMPETGMIDPQFLIDTFKQLCDLAVAQGLTIGKEAPRSYGGRAPQAPKAEVPAPDGIDPPMHCGQPCEYKEAWLNRKTGKTISPKFQCRAGDACTDKALTGYPWSVFVDRWVKAQAGA